MASWLVPHACKRVHYAHEGSFSRLGIACARLHKQKGSSGQTPYLQPCTELLRIFLFNIRRINRLDYLYKGCGLACRGYSRLKFVSIWNFNARALRTSCRRKVSVDVGGTRKFWLVDRVMSATWSRKGIFSNNAQVKLDVLRGMKVIKTWHVMRIRGCCMSRMI